MDYLEQIRDYNTRASWPAAGRTALAVIDMQEFFDDISLQVLPQVSALVDAARSAGVPVVFTRHGHRDLAVDGGALAPWWDFHLAMVGTPEWQLMAGLVPRPGEVVIDKTRYSAFYGTGFEGVLRARGVTDLVICGVMTNCCCETTARDAFMRDFRVFVAADATNTATEDLHVSSLKGMAFACAHVMTTVDLVDALGAGAVRDGSTTPAR